MSEMALNAKNVLLHDWHRRLTAVFAGLFLYQFASWFAMEEGLWLPLTSVLIKVTLGLMVVVELLPRIKWFVTGFIQLVLVGVLTAAATGFQWTGPSRAKDWQWAQTVYDNLAQLHPLIWFSGGAWLIYLFVLWWVRRKSRIFLLVVAGVFLIAIRDSFSQLILWQHAAIMIFSGLCLIVIRHFSDLKREKPAVWGYFAKYPLPLAFSIISLLVVTMALGMLAPDVNNILKDPYTLYKNWKGETVVPAGKTVSSGILSGGGAANSSSGYSRDDRNLGGNFTFDYTPVMTVNSPQRGYWRGETRAFYDGKGWSESPVEKKNPQLVQVSPDAPLPQEPLLKGKKPPKSVEVRQTITITKNEGFPVLFGAYSIRGVESINGEKANFDRLRWSGLSAELEWTKGSKDYPKTYTVVSEMPIIDEDALRGTSRTPEENEMLGDYLQLPDTVPSRVKELAARIVAGSSNDYDKAKLLQQYLQSNFRYTNSPNNNGSDKMDFVDRFLFEIKEGYCDYFSSSMAILSRSVGIPARWVKGYASGSLPFDEETGIPDNIRGLINDASGTGVYTVRNSDAHSWVELYFSGWGWIPFEATAGFTAPAPQPESQAEAPAAIDTPNNHTAPAAKEESAGWPAAVKWSVAAAAVLLMCATAWYILHFRGMDLYTLIFRRRYSKLSLNQQVIWEYNRLLRTFRRKGMPAFEHETARETVKRWSAKDRWLIADLEQLLALFEKAKYSPSAVSPEEASRTSFIVRKLRKAM